MQRVVAKAARAVMRLVYLVFLGVVLGVPSARADVMLHAFNWRYADIGTQAQTIRDNGYRIVLVSPPLRSEGAAWWGRYQPQDYRVIDNPLGNTESFRTMIDQLGAKGVRVYADIVLNHMANEAATRIDLDYPGRRILDIYRANPAYFSANRLFGDLRFNFLSQWDFHEARCIADYSNTFQVQNWRLCMGAGDVGLPDLTDNDWVVSQQRAYLQALKALGVTGFRIDAAKHMSATQIARIFTTDVTSGMHVFGEVITSAGEGNDEYRLFLKPYLQNTNHGAYDFPLHGALRRAFSPAGSMSELVDPLSTGQALLPARAITFTVTHDIPNNSIFRFMLLDPTDETLAYAYVLGRDGGVPLVYSDHNESGDNRWVDAYRRADLTAMIGFHNQLQGHDMQVLSHGACHLIFRRGSRGIVAINKCGQAQEAAVSMHNSVLWWHSPYRDVVTGSSLTIDRADFRFQLPPRSARLWIRQ
ncbi:alpha-amylase family protein [Tahibacter amnicola]|uniref:Alpha-amylase n=1 Tax=Tahibacter amnicola TaxID=2976241 RepID=A0ABY6BE42_9GAMM|nr:alpha-amylase family protein [Tahibacter amnicola]UXI68114.1 alpha-amylase family protein [Tahibacter amnicola]